MSYNGSGVYTLPGAQLANGATVSATENNQFRNDVAAALNVAWTRDGQAPATNDIPMGSNKLTELAQPTTEGDALAFGKNATVDDLAVTGNQTVTGNSNVTGTASLGGEYLTPYTGFKNRIINGEMGISQRGTSISSGIGILTYTLDRWICAASGAALTVAQGSASSWPYNYMTVDGAASNTAWNVRQRIESKNIQDCAGAQVTISFYCYNTTGNASSTVVAIYSANAVDNFTSTTLVSSQSVNLSLTTTRQSFTFTLTSACANGIEIQIGSNSGFTSGTLALHTVQLEKGSTATSFDYRPYGTELALCQRYFEVSGTNAFSTAAGFCGSYFSVTKRVSPTIVQTGGISVSFSGVGTNGVYVSGGTTTGYSYTASAEL